MTEKGPDNPRQKKEIHRVRLKRPPERLYYSISDVGEMVKVKPYVLRFWEKEFPMLRPKKNRAGNRIYQKKDIQLIERIRDLLYRDGYTILGARQKLRGERARNRTVVEMNVLKKDLEGGDHQEIRKEIAEIRREVEELIALFS